MLEYAFMLHAHIMPKIMLAWFAKA